MNLKTLIYFACLLVKLIDSYQLIAKSWESTCSILLCEQAISQCVKNGCLGPKNCQSCLNINNPSCSVCYNDIINEDDQYQSNGEPTIICDASNEFHKLTCQFFCRIKFKTNSQCYNVNKIPVCNCIDEITTTTTPIPNPSINLSLNMNKICFI